ncbi:deoxycytidine kinase [Flamingopox virus FGPVKD09]|uniref:Deoxycytidine kinase n=1 Tax=Flamingopox virus FGPVKD09 TaxID=2059380 RepID=A0A2H4X2H0_9POXV|nr:deoxycytidine kinase [Flamingopox virus FGPVKD09]AUD40254.1 deoxycytidine kinase [Flamingopox virus FGPVKD09]
MAFQELCSNLSKFDNCSLLETDKKISVEGNISAGKSTLLNILSDNGYNVVQEPLEQWRGKILGTNLLEKLYKDPSRWGYTFQAHAFWTRIKTYIDALNKNKGNVILERSVFSDKYVFATALHDIGYIDDTEWAIYNEYSKWMTEFMDIKIDGIIYLKTSPDTCYKRMLNRARPEENNVKIDYLNRLHDNHEKWLSENDKHEFKVPVLEINGDSDFINDNKKQVSILSDIYDFISGLYI